MSKVDKSPYIKIETSRGYKGFFWDIYVYCPEYKKHRTATRGGYAITRWGAKRAGNKALKKYLGYSHKEWIIRGDKA
jgi:hypothetical protein